MSGTADSVSFSVPLDAGACLQAWEGWPTNGLYDKMTTLSEATYAEIAAELRRRAERYDAEEVSLTASIAELLRNYDPEQARWLRQVAERLEAMG